MIAISTMVFVYKGCWINQEVLNNFRCGLINVKADGGKVNQTIKFKVKAAEELGSVELYFYLTRNKYEPTYESPYPNRTFVTSFKSSNESRLKHEACAFTAGYTDDTCTISPTTQLSIELDSEAELGIVVTSRTQWIRHQNYSVNTIAHELWVTVAVRELRTKKLHVLQSACATRLFSGNQCKAPVSDKKNSGGLSKGLVLAVDILIPVVLTLLCIIIYCNCCTPSQAENQPIQPLIAETNNTPNLSDVKNANTADHVPQTQYVTKPPLIPGSVAHNLYLLQHPTLAEP